MVDQELAAVVAQAFHIAEDAGDIFLLTAAFISWMELALFADPSSVEVLGNFRSFGNLSIYILIHQPSKSLDFSMKIRCPFRAFFY